MKNRCRINRYKSWACWI